MGLVTFATRLRLPTVVSAARRTFRMSSAREQSEKVLEELKEKNPYFDKYAQKIAQVQQTSPEEFLSRLDQVEKDKKKPKFGGKRDYSELSSPKPALGAPAAAADGSKKLSDIMKLELVENKTVEEIKHIWLEYHKTKESVSAVIDVEQFDRIMSRAKEFPVFIFPLPRDQGYEFIMHQFAGNTIHFTPLLSYQVHKENAPECLNIVHYTEFRDRGIILMRGEFDTKIINALEAQCLVNQLQMYYGQNDAEKLALLKVFTQEPAKFKHMDVIKHLENIQLK